MKSCETCKLSGLNVAPDKSMSMVCRADPPKVTAVPVPVNGGQIGWISATSWPVVSGNDWCGRHEIKLEIDIRGSN